MTSYRPSAARAARRGRAPAVALVLGAHLVCGPAFAADAPFSASHSTMASAAPATRSIPIDTMAPVHREAYLRAIRAQLAGYGYGAGAGSAGGAPSLSHAIRAYQRDAGLPVDGVATRELLDHLLFVRPAMTVRPARVAAVPRPARDVPGSRAVPVAPQEPAKAVMPKLPLAPVTRGDLAPLPDAPEPRKPATPAESAGPARGGGVITRVQRALRYRGFYSGPVDGVFAPGLAAAIGRFQADAGLAVTRVIDARLLNALSAPSRTARRAGGAGNR